MTREESILKWIMPAIKNTWNEKKCNEILKALEQEPCEDCISKKELLRIYEDRFLELQKLKHLKDNKGAEDRQMGVNYCINILKEMPLVTPKPKTESKIHCNCTDAEIAKSFIEDVEAVKDLLPQESEEKE